MSSTPTASRASEQFNEVSLRRVPHRRSRTRTLLKAYAEDRAAVIAAVVLLVMALAAILAPVISPHDPTAADPTRRMEAIGASGHLLGLDYQGRDMLSRLMWGGRTSLPNAIIPVAISASISLILGLTAGYVGGFLDSLIMRMMDVVIAVPGIILAIAIAASMGRGSLSVILATSLTIIAPMTRMTYAATRECRQAEYITAAVAIGAPLHIIIRRHLFLNVLAPILVYATTIIGIVIVFTASLSFLGLGVAPPTPDWGLMVDEGRRVMATAPHVAALPGIAISVAALCFNLIGDGLRYALDPRQHRH